MNWLLLFKLHQFHLGRTYYVLLPKLNPIQMRVMAERLGKMGELIGSSGLLLARVKQGIIHLDPSGLCWSTTDPADIVLPAVPDLLSCRKVKISQKELESKYFITSEVDGALNLRLLTRLESGPTWKVLRAFGRCALTPDERMVATHLMKNAGRDFRMIADFPTTGSTERIFGRRHYFESTVASFDPLIALRVAGSKAARNAYLPQDGFLHMTRAAGGPPDETRNLLNSLGDWCFFSSE